ncbi:penicillin-binding protein [Streptomyces sp. SID8375]|uniref:Penicillin-binding protein n=1 Tax=Streptomyces nigrescens TaxID=1920 RepID=A0A640TLX7_STRNI|nr:MULTISPECIES: penicillin-binding transpeptidase domain-containing protein [Streptomyces]MCX5450989.1 penicillin-binding transpeptidase domain-containing protein [Streptomyces libani]MYX09003.1 penicillin-binding protein [Streptomyces sp. SID8375]WAT98550.1 penicillin-binding transpeptidase domain-containing protein [Streptomyces libani subsp. libani]WDT55671.1 penicillin-binding transpeptidase domain-containing protein [Streptomyces sp. G7(2002)]GFE24180.1 penicillin-binding protein [Strept
MRREVKYGLIGGSVALVAGVVGGFTLFGGSDESPQEVRSADAKSGENGTKVATGPLSAKEVQTTSREFLTAWQSGDAAKAAGLTDDPAKCKSALEGLAKQARFSKVTLTPGAPTGGKVPYTVAAQIDYKGAKSAYSYRTSATVERDKATGKPQIAWQPTMMHPGLAKGDQLRTGEAEAPPIKAVDRKGAALTPEAHPALAGVLDSLRDKYGDKTDGKPGVELFIHRAKSAKPADQLPDKTLKVLSKGTPGTLKTTLDAGMQSAAERAVKGKKSASVAAVKPSTGEILALANSPEKGFNLATQGSLAPGSTMKVVTAAMLMDKGMTSPGKSHPCPKYVTVGGWKFQNLNKSEIKNGTFAQSFAASCNNAFISQAKDLSDDDLTKEARDVFGIGLNWQTGIPTFDGAVPVQSDAQMAASLIGQGGVRMNPLNVATLSATVRAGSFHQPYIVSPSLDHRTLAKAPRTMKPSTLSGLRSLMKLTATSGTAAEAMSGVSGDVGAKTGSAEVDGQKKPNAWFTAYRDDLAAAAVVPASGHGGSNAGPVVRALLTAG